MSAQTPIARVEGLGASHSGTVHFWRQRVSALALVPLSIWFVCMALSLIGANRHEAIDFLSVPINAILMALFVIAALHHLVLGVQVVIERATEIGPGLSISPEEMLRFVRALIAASDRAMAIIASAHRGAELELAERAHERRAAGVRYVSYREDYGSTAYGWAMEDTTSFCKVLADPASGQLLGAHLLGPDFAKLADAFGIPAFRARTPDEVDPAIEAAQAVDGPALIWF